FVKLAHEKGIRVIFDGVFNHTGRNFFAMQDIRKNRENSPYRDWYQNVNFWGNNEFNDGFSYDNWGGYNIMAKLNQKNPAVKDYICDVIRFWVSEYDVDGIRLDAADVLDFEFMKALRQTANEVKPEFWLMGEVIHGEYSRWVNEGTLHSVTNYHLHKALYSGHNDHNYFEIAHTVKRLYGMGGNRADGLKLYNFVDNHDVERIYTKLWNKAHYVPVHVLLYTLPGIPSVYYGSEFGIEGKKTYGTDAPLRPCLKLEDFGDYLNENACAKLIAALGRIHQSLPALSYGDYQELLLTNRQYAFSRNLDGKSVLVAVNNDDNEAGFRLPAGNVAAYVGLLSGKRVEAADGCIHVRIPGCGGDIFVAEGDGAGAFDGKLQETLKVEEVVKPKAPPKAEKAAKPEEPPKAEELPKPEEPTAQESPVKEPPEQKREGFVDKSVTEGKSYESMTVEELQEAILSKMAGNGPVTEQMLRSVRENIYPNSLLNWVKSFR
ncbi:MAG: alpha-amylase, partial [Lachnospiraceae bacterium]|nr:alpha-amylase [Lachnospiraceae bacterium]